MFAFLVAVGALFVAVAVAAAIDPRPRQTNDDDDCVSTINEIALSV